MRAPLRLDRFIPNSATASNRSVMDLAAGIQHFIGENRSKNPKKRPTPQNDSSQDQVVPDQFERNKGDKDDNAPRNKRGGN